MGIATHVAFLDAGELLFQESIGDVIARFPEVRVTLEREPAAPTHAPSDWLQVRTVGNVVSFVDTQFSKDGLGERIKALLPGVRGIDARPMGLRSIFTTLARAAREGAV